MILGLHGFAQSGKDTMAGILIEKLGYRRIAFADILREALYRLDPVVGFTNGELLTVTRVVDEIGWEKAKVQYSEVRRLLQVIGTEVGRDLIDENVWVNLAMKGVGVNDKVVVTDVRYPNEIDAINKLNGVLIKIRRPDLGPVNNHVSDSGLPDEMFDFIIDNEGSVEDFKNKTLNMFAEFQKVALFKDAPPRYGDFKESQEQPTAQL